MQPALVHVLRQVLSPDGGLLCCQLRKWQSSQSKGADHVMYDLLMTGMWQLRSMQADNV